MSEEPDRARLPERIARHLLRSIVNRTIRPGERLPSERSLASRLGVNRASLREALKQLEHMGLIRTRQGDGTRVLDFMSVAGLELLQHLLPLVSRDSPQLLEDLLEVRQILGREVARLAAGRRGPEDMAELRRVQQEAAQGDRGGQALFLWDVDFFAALGQATHNQVARLLVNSIRTAVAHRADLFIEDMPPAEVTRDYHREMLEHLSVQDGEAAAAATHAYLGRWLGGEYRQRR